MIRTTKKIRGRAAKALQISLSVLSIGMLFANSTAAALSPNQINAYRNGAWYTNTEEDICVGTAASITTTANMPAVYATLFTKAAAAAGTNPQFLAAIFVTEHGNVWPNPAGPWASSPVGASGPFQFMPATWQAYKTDGDGDGKTDVQNLADASYSAAKYLNTMGATTSSPLGDLNHPYGNKPPSLLYIAGEYNAGPGNMQRYTNPTSTVDPLGLPAETVRYVKNVYYLISTGFSHGVAGYGSADGTVKDSTSGATSSVAGSATGATSSHCGGAAGNGIVMGSVVKTALGLAWPEPFSQKPSSETARISPLTPTPAYKAAVQQFFPSAPSDGADCGVFVSIVMHASGADTSYPKVGTSVQQSYVESSSKYMVYKNIQSTADLQPGDILIVNSGGGTGASGHTMIFVGAQPSGYNQASASLGSRMPNQGMTPSNLVDELGRGHYVVARLK